MKLKILSALLLWFSCSCDKKDNYPEGENFISLNSVNYKIIGAKLYNPGIKEYEKKGNLELLSSQQETKIQLNIHANGLFPVGQYKDTNPYFIQIDSLRLDSLVSNKVKSKSFFYSKPVLVKTSGYGLETVNSVLISTKKGEAISLFFKFNFPEK